MDRSRLTEIILEEVSKSDVEKSISDNNNKFLKSRDFKDAVEDVIKDYIKKREFKDTIENISRDILEVFFERLWARKSFFKDCIGK